MENFYIDEERDIVLVETDEFDPNGYNLIVEYTIDEWNKIFSDDK
jgi:hypothetical protein|tara:strand:- start:98 stop:232 length:135 start_codon:yes stop_codon:yes gene_type:complete